jgi:transcriptional regulator with XRE-family HTH domain
MARAALQMGVRDLAKLSGISAMTITRFENGHSGGHADTLRRLEGALVSAGVEFIPDGGVRLKAGSPDPKT